MDFAKHKIEKICEHPKIKRYKFSQSDTWCYGFFLTFSDNLIVLNGDIGTLVVEPGYGRDGLAFLRGSLNSTSYFLSKVPYELRESLTEFKVDYAREELESLVSDGYLKKETSDSIIEQVSYIGDNKYGQMKFQELCYEAGIDEPPSGTKIHPHTEFQLKAMRCFLEKLDSPNHPEPGGE